METFLENVFAFRAATAVPHRWPIQTGDPTHTSL